MADLRITPPNLPATTARVPADSARVQAARAASRAFFEAALGKVADTPAPAPAAAPQAQPSARSGEPQRLLRPGSILDIKV